MLIKRTRSEKQIAASRANGKRSKGPVTALGKSISSRNAVKHGFRASEVRDLQLNPVRFAEITQQHALELDPQNPEETALIDEMATALCRAETVWALMMSPGDLPHRQAALFSARLRFGANYVKALSKFRALRRRRCAGR